MSAANRTAAGFRLRPHPHLFEINTWAWLEQLSTRNGHDLKLADVPDEEWDALAKMGFNIIWLMGVWRRSDESRRIMLEDQQNFPQYERALPGWKPADIVGSPYAVADYSPDPRIGGWDSLDLVRDKLHAQGMALFLDFVGNHTALDHPWVSQHPEYYVQVGQQDFQRNPSFYYSANTVKGRRFIALAKDPYYPPWKDVAQLNHFDPALRAAQIAELRSIANHCDGVRCDMAMLQLNDIFAQSWEHLLGNVQPPAKEFWTEFRAAVPNLVLLAEAYWGTEQRLLDLGFSFAYDKALYDAVRDIHIPQVRERLNTGAQQQSHFARFMENHDEARRPEVFGNDRLASAGTLMGTLPGMGFYHQGELEGRTIHLPITLRMAADEPLDPVSIAFFQKILQITQQDVFHDGEWNLLQVLPEGDVPTEGLIVYEWRSANAWKVIAVNITGTAMQGRVRFGDHISPSRQYDFHDELDEVHYARNGEELDDAGLFIRREGFQAHLFDVKVVPLRAVDAAAES
ncbi:MAG: alpha-amylase family glycosyl hydrolase [Candidatus Acidiferrales bacterium]